jgi:hypothetical protein
MRNAQDGSEQNDSVALDLLLLGSSDRVEYVQTVHHIMTVSGAWKVSRDSRHQWPTVPVDLLKLIHKTRVKQRERSNQLIQTS